MAEKHFTIDVEENTQENALFEDDKFVCFEGDTDEYLKKINEMSDEIEQLKQRIKSRLHYYRELCNEFDKDDGFTYNIVKRIVEDLEDILK